MRIDSRLMKTEMELESIERREDRLLMLSPPDDWNETKVYLSPQDVVTVLRISFHRGMIAYLLLFPFFLVADYLRREKDINEIVHNISYFIAVVFMGLLLLGGTTFLLAEPLSSALVLSILAALIFLVTVLSGKSGFLYLGLPFSVIAYFLLGFAREVDIRSFPLLALGVVLTLLILGKSIGDEHESKLSRPFYHIAYLTILIFVGYLIFNLSTYALEAPWQASIPLLGFALFHYVRFFDTGEVLQHYAASILLGIGFLLAIYGIPDLQLAYFGLPLIGLSMAMILIADRYHESHGMAQVAPAYSVAIGLALLAFVYAYQDLTALLLSLAFFSAHFFGGTYSLGIKSAADQAAEKSFQWVEFTLANISAGIAAALMLTIGRTNWASIVAAAVYIYYYRKMGFSREPTILETRNQYIWIAGGFYSVLIFVVLGIFDPLKNLQTDMLLVPLLLLPLLLYGRYIFNQGNQGIAYSIYESSLLTILVSLLLPTVMDNFQVFTASIVAGLFVLLYGLLGWLWREEILFYAMPFLVAHLIYNAMTFGNVSGIMVGFVYLLLGILVLAAALFYWKRGSGPIRTLFISWFIFSSASVFGVMTDRSITIYLIALWAALYFLAASVVTSAEGQRKVSEAGSHV